MKRFLTTFFALTLFSTVGVLGGSIEKAEYRKTSLGDILTINGVPLNSIDWGVNNKPNRPNKPNKPQNPNNTTTTQKQENQNKPTTTTEATTEATTENIEKPNNNVSSISAIEKEVVRLVNIERKQAGLNPLQIDTQVSNVARLKSEDMRDRNYFNHTSPTYGSPFDMLKRFNITYKTAGENIAKGQKTAEAVVEAWMNSEGHRRNILSKSFTHIGVGYAKKGSTTYWTQMFITK